MNHQQPHTTNNTASLCVQKFRIAGVDTDERVQFVIRLLKNFSSIVQVNVNREKKLIRIVSEHPVTLALIHKKVSAHGFSLAPVDEMPVPQLSTAGKILKMQLTGTTCRSCEITIEREWLKVKGVEKVDVDAVRGVARIVCGDCIPNFDELQSAIADHGYTVQGVLNATKPTGARTHGVRRPSFWQLVGLFALVLFLGTIFSRLGFLRPNVALGAATSVGAVFLLGLVAASSSCIAVSGGLLLSSAAKFNERYASRTPLARMRPVALFVVGRIVAYTILGALIGTIGNALTPSPLVTGLLTAIAALAMLVMGLDMLHLAPAWFKLLIPRLPKRFSHAAINVEKKDHPSVPFLLGGATFFLPCGFTTALQLYVLTTGSALTGASLLGAFALGTAPALLALGWASSALKGTFGRFFFQLSGALVVMLGLWNMQNAFTIAGFPISARGLTHLFVSKSEAGNIRDPNVIFNGREQTVRMTVNGYGYAPDHFTLRQNVPTRWIIDTQNNSGCLSVLQVPRLGIRKLLQVGNNTIEFTPTVAGTIPFSCSMGMFRGEINVVPNT